MLRLNPLKPAAEALDRTWSFPPDQERRYTYGIENLPNIRTGSGIYELSLSDAVYAEPGQLFQYEVHCSKRTETWPPPHTEPTF